MSPAVIIHLAKVESDSGVQARHAAISRVQSPVYTEVKKMYSLRHIDAVGPEKPVRGLI
jgi:hypothetical protein